MPHPHVGRWLGTGLGTDSLAQRRKVDLRGVPGLVFMQSEVPGAEALAAECSGIMPWLVWARNQPMVSRYTIACLDRMSCW